MKSIAGLIVAIVFLSAGSATAQSGDNCLYSLWTGTRTTRIEPCTEGDPANLAANRHIRAVMIALSLDASAVHFRGCKGASFAAYPDVSSADGKRRYLITYPIEIDDPYTAPIAHELAHVFQMELAGGIAALRQHSSKQIELGADYLTGVVFAQALHDLPYTDFQHNLSLTGLYREPNEDAHGTPTQRTGAFRLGANKEFDEVGRSMRLANDDFFANEYAQILNY